jgi:hypothetical protein
VKWGTASTAATLADRNALGVTVVGMGVGICLTHTRVWRGLLQPEKQAGHFLAYRALSRSRLMQLAASAKINENYNN